MGRGASLWKVCFPVDLMLRQDLGYVICPAVGTTAHAMLILDVRQ